MSNNTSSFYGAPLFFTAQIQPPLFNGISSATLVFSHYHCAQCGDFIDPLYPGITQSMTAVNATSIEVPLSCSQSGLCSATIPSSETTARSMANGQYTYTYKFTTTNGDIFQQTFQNSLTPAP
jgi:hypothetical protein